MVADIATTNYAISNNLGYESNRFMSGVVSNPILFILVKLIVSLVIIMLTAKCIQQNKKITHIGMKIIIFMMLFVIGNNLLVISANALSFSNLSVGGTGSVNTGNGYFDSPGTAFEYTGTRNIYLIAENTAVYILEPMSYASSGSNAIQLVNSSFGTITDAVVHNGYIYFIDAGILKKRSGHSENTLCESNDTSAGGCITTIATGVGNTLRVYSDVLYYTDGATLRHLDINDNSVADFNLQTIPGSQAEYSSFTIAENNSNIQAYTVSESPPNFIRVTASTSLGHTVILSTLAGTGINYATIYTTETQIYILDHGTTGGSNIETKLYISNSSTITTDYSTSDALAQYDRAYVGGQSTIGLIAQSSTTYETFNSNEAGIDSLPTVPTELSYTTSLIESLDDSYYNRSTIYIQYNVVLTTDIITKLTNPYADYRWVVSIEDPNGVTTDIVQTPECQYESLTDITCQIDSTMGLSAPSSGWIQGTWNAKLYEKNIVTLNRALVATSSDFTILNTTIENQTIVPPPEELPTSGTGANAISIIDGIVSWLGMGVNSVSKLLFAMIIIAIATTVGLIYGNGNVAMVFAFIPYAFFTFIDYIPKWIFIISIILIAIASKAFR